MTAKKIFFILFVLMHVFGTAQTHIIAGSIVEQSTGAAVPFAVIYFPDLSKSIVADGDGKFLAKNIPGERQSYTVVCLGYRPFASFVLLPDSINSLRVALERGSRETEEVVIFGTQTHTEDQSAGKIESISQATMRRAGALSISDGIAKLPGVTQLSTGAGISKPVIRGLYGNRIQTVVMGLRFDNQQWQDEHGLGLSDIGVDRVEVIKGPAALMYGSEAMGGVVNVIEEKPALMDSMQADVSTRVYSNTYGASMDAGVRRAAGGHFWRVRVGADSHGDYSDGNNERVFNSRFDSYIGKATFGFNRSKWVCVNNYVWSKSDFGFIMDTANALIPDGRLSRDLSNPHHTVFINLLTTQNTFFGKHSTTYRLNGGLHLNRRLENEGGGGISLDMQLLTAAIHAQLERPLNTHTILTAGLQSQFQNNTNFGFRVIVPDARLFESSLYGYLKSIREALVLEAGLRYDFRYIATDPIVTATSALLPVQLSTIQKGYQSVNGSLGTSVKLIDDLHLKANVTSGYRTPNLAELQSNGVHEGTLRYEIGNPDMNVEQNICAELSLNYESSQFGFSINAYNNRFLNYIYLQPTPLDWFGFTEYQFVQQNATLRGGEATLDWSPLKMIDVSLAYSTIRAKTDENKFLPFIPADRMDGSVKFELGDYGNWTDTYVRLGGQYAFAQQHPAQFETTTSSYYLLDAGFGTAFHFDHKQIMTMDVHANNLLNEVYYDHLSRFKDFGIYNMGRNISLNLKYEW